MWNGPIKGYYVGYKVYDSKDSYLYKTLEVGQGTREEVLLTQLQKFTSYSVLVQAYNSMGAGPRSDEVIVQTLEDGNYFLSINTYFQLFKYNTA